MNKFYLTTPIYYPNARLHAGHAYTTLVSDALARYKRQCGYNVRFLTGTDEHGEKLQRAATAAGMTPQAFVAGKRREIRELWKLLEIEYTHFVYTDRADHIISVQRMLKRAQQAGYVYKGHYQGRYCIHDERYLSEGTDPVVCDICGRPGELISEDNWFFKLSAFQEKLLAHFEKNPEFVTPNFRFNEVKSFVKSGLRDISISRRRIKWGIPWPDDPEQVFYVWYDALTSYMTGIGYGKAEGGDETFRKFWPADVHMIGKDIIRFHAVYWPAFLMAAYPGEPEMLPRQIVAHGWLLVGQDKMSKSKGNAVYVEPVAKFFKEETKGVVSGSDVLRYYVLREFIFGQDGSVSYERMLERYNSDLANGLGNLANRTIVMLNRYFDAIIPSPDNGWSQREATLMATAGNEKMLYLQSFEGYEFSRGLDAVWNLISETNKYLVVNQPWAISPEIAAREGEPIAVSITPPRAGVHDATDSVSKQARLAAILYAAAEVVRIASVLLYPVIPKSADRIWKQLGCNGNLKDQNPNDLQWGGLKPGTKVGKPDIIFPRLDVDATIGKLLKIEAAEQAVAPVYDRRNVEASAKKGTTTVENQPEQKPVPEKTTAPNPESRTPSPASQAAQPNDQKITIDDFAKVEMRVGEVLSAEKIPNATKLLKIMVDIGTEVRQVLAGIAEHYQPEQLVGMKVVVVTNLQPRKMRGLESNGMIVAASVGEEGRPVLVTFKEEVPKGARLK